MNLWLNSYQPDELLLGLIMPGKDGTSIARKLRYLSQAPIMPLEGSGIKTTLTL